jgi:hypothetical protein
MGIVTDHLRAVIAREVDRHGLVVWFDPERQYVDAAADLELPDTAVARYDGSFFALRHGIDPLLQGDEPPRLVVYVPLDSAATANALCEAQAAGVTMCPGQQPPSRNTRLAVVARNALREQMGEEAIKSLEKQIEGGKLTIAELDQLAEKGIVRGVVSVIFGADEPDDIALAFLSDAECDQQIEDRSALPELMELLDGALASPESNDEAPADYRARVARHVLCTDFVANLRGGVPDRFATMNLPPPGPARDACVGLATTWRARRDLRDSYAAEANGVAQSVGVVELDLGLGDAEAVETFREVELSLQGGVEGALLAAATPELVELADSRQSSFWAEQDPSVQARWALIAISGRLLLEAERVDQESKSAGADPVAFCRSYAEGDTPWCLLDTHHRHLERHWHRFDLDAAGGHGQLQLLVTAARTRYTAVCATLAERFLRGYAEASLAAPGAARQADVFGKWVCPALAETKTAYLLVDALRFEMARELSQSLSDGCECELQWVLGRSRG